ncbi:LysR substrate-binding domain-containing protein [Enterovirga rhinocerotis]|uniref:DNA-binding transcriptional LysR family regulator n=1 Tax=Enterovirga rhinocerotis TaxID=1339210 RepID=A0A4V3DYJ9_9HYPH|nr:LysR substrate-binding domain-containing protein [Enterovirga rhinocerotis]TDR92919.1 DNA-binding transcriptional LysR family regulator [Enterovirga rhinocerotis]
MLHLDLRTARLLIAAVEEESIAAAAEREGLAVSAASRRLQQLEAALGLALLRRHRRGVEVTAGGMVVLRRARAMLHEVAQLEVDLAGIRAGLSGRVRLCANETALVEFLPSILPAFLESHPGIEVDLDERNSAKVVRAVWQNSADIGIYVGDVPPIDLWRRPVFRDRLVVVVHRDHPLAARGEASMVDIVQHEVVGQPEEGAMSHLLTRAAAAYHRVLKIRVRVDGYDAVCSIAETGQAIGIVSESSARRYATSTQLVVLPILDEWAAREHQLCARNPKDLGPAQRALLDHIIQRSGFGSL